MVGRLESSADSRTSLDVEGREELALMEHDPNDEPVLYEERDGDMIVFDFDPNYRTALTALLRNAAFPKFPDVKTLEGKEIVVSGNFVDYHGKAQIELTDPAQIKLVK